MLIYKNKDLSITMISYKYISIANNCARILKIDLKAVARDQSLLQKVKKQETVASLK